MSFGIVWNVLGWGSGRRRKAFRRRCSRGKKDQGIWLQRYFGIEAADPASLPGTGTRSCVDRDSTVEWCIREVFEQIERLISVHTVTLRSGRSAALEYRRPLH